MGGRDEAASLASRLLEYRRNPHHINPMSERFQHLIGDVIEYLAKDQNWQPIETVPKTGRKFCGYDSGPMVLLATEGEDSVVIAFWNGRAFDDGDFNSYMTGFTHWQPLPSPPKPNTD